MLTCLTEVLDARPGLLPLLNAHEFFDRVLETVAWVTVYFSGIGPHSYSPAFPPEPPATAPGEGCRPQMVPEPTAAPPPLPGHNPKLVILTTRLMDLALRSSGVDACAEADGDEDAGKRAELRELAARLRMIVVEPFRAEPLDRTLRRAAAVIAPRHELQVCEGVCVSWWHWFWIGGAVPIRRL